MNGARKPDFMRAREVAEACDISTDTLRHYERKGVLPAPRRSRNGYREYPVEALQRVRLVRRLLEIGFTLDELAQIFKTRDGGGAPCHDVRALAAAKLSEIERRLDELGELREELQKILTDWDLRLAKRATGQRAGLLESLGATTLPEKRHAALAATWQLRKKKGE